MFYHKIRLVIEYHFNHDAKELFDSDIEVNKSYFSSVRKGKQDRGAVGKTSVFGLLKRNSKVFVVVKDTKSTH